MSTIPSCYKFLLDDQAVIKPIITRSCTTDNYDLVIWLVINKQHMAQQIVTSICEMANDPELPQNKIYKILANVIKIDLNLLEHVDNIDGLVQCLIENNEWFTLRLVLGKIMLDCDLKQIFSNDAALNILEDKLMSSITDKNIKHVILSAVETFKLDLLIKIFMAQQLLLTNDMLDDIISSIIEIKVDEDDNRLYLVISTIFECLPSEYNYDVDIGLIYSYDAGNISLAKFFIENGAKKLVSFDVVDYYSYNKINLILLENDMLANEDILFLLDDCIYSPSTIKVETSNIIISKYFRTVTTISTLFFESHDNFNTLHDKYYLEWILANWEQIYLSIPSSDIFTNRVLINLDKIDPTLTYDNSYHMYIDLLLQNCIKYFYVDLARICVDCGANIRNINVMSLVFNLGKYRRHVDGLFYMIDWLIENGALFDSKLFDENENDSKITGYVCKQFMNHHEKMYQLTLHKQSMIKSATK